jgi:hypothetical protein
MLTSIRQLTLYIYNIYRASRRGGVTLRARRRDLKGEGIYIYNIYRASRGGGVTLRSEEA